MITANSSFPVFVVNRLDTARHYYTEHFSFDIAFENEWYLHLVTAAGIQIGFMLPEQATQPEIFHPAYPGQGVIFSFEVEDVDNAYGYAQEHHLQIVLSLRSEEWGQRHFCVEDPNGIHLDVVQAIKPSEAYGSSFTA